MNTLCLTSFNECNVSESHSCGYRSFFLLPSSSLLCGQTLIRLSSHLLSPVSLLRIKLWWALVVSLSTCSHFSGDSLGMRLGPHTCWVYSFLSSYQFQLLFNTPASDRGDLSSLPLAVVTSLCFGHRDVVLLSGHGNLNSPMTPDFEHLLIHLVVACIFSFVKCLFKCFAFVIGFFLLSYIFWTKFFFVYI